LKISWLGHSCFEIVDSEGRTIVTDPFDDTVGYDLPRVRADVITMSHDHHDHNNIGVVEGEPPVVTGSGRQTVAGIEFEGVQVFHDELGGKLRGKNVIFCFSVDGVRVCHLGDLGHLLSEDEVNAVGDVDVLLIPVGGVYTIDAAGAKKVVEQIKPRLVIPMHFRSDAFDVDPVDWFLEGQKVERPGKSITEDDLPIEGRKIVLLECDRPSDR